MPRTGRDLAGISRELRAMGDGRAIRRSMTREIRSAARPLIPAVRAAIDANVPRSGAGRGPSLADRLKKAVKLTVRTSGKQAGVTVRVDGRAMPPKQGSLPAYVEGTKRPWKHPVYGNRNAWVQQQSHPYFYSTVTPLGARARKNVNRVLDEITRKIT